MMEDESRVIEASFIYSIKIVYELKYEDPFLDQVFSIRFSDNQLAKTL